MVVVPVGGQQDGSVRNVILSNILQRKSSKKLQFLHQKATNFNRIGTFTVFRHFLFASLDSAVVRKFVHTCVTQT